MPIDAVVGCSVGGLVGALYAGAGLEPEGLVEAASRLTPWTLPGLALTRWRLPGLSRRAARASGGLDGYLARLEESTFERLHHGVRRLGILVWDVAGRRERLVCGGPGLAPPSVPLGRAVMAAVSIPGLFPPVAARIDGSLRLLVDAGWHTAVPIERAFAPPIAARRVIAVDLGIRITLRQRRAAYWDHLGRACGDRLLLIRPRVGRFGTALTRRGDAERLIAAGEAAVGERETEALRAWA